MALILMSSVKGSPGVTTASVGMWERWGSPVLLVETDVSGSSVLAGRFRGEIPGDRGIYQLTEDYDPSRGLPLDIASQAIDMGSQRFLLPGITWAPQATSLANLWSHIAENLVALSNAGVDVLVDMGRILLPYDARSPLLSLADQVLIFTHSSLPALFALSDLAQRVKAVRTQGIERVGLVVVGPNRPYSIKDLSRNAGVDTVTTIPFLPDAARYYGEGVQLSRRAQRQIEDAMSVASTQLRDHITRLSPHNNEVIS